MKSKRKERFHAKAQKAVFRKKALCFFFVLKVQAKGQSLLNLFSFAFLRVKNVQGKTEQAKTHLAFCAFA